MDRHYKSLVLTDHAMERLDKRSITAEMVYQVVTTPAKTYPAGDNTKYIKTIKDRRVHVIAHYMHDERKWLIISVWVRGEGDKLPLIWQLITLPFVLIWKVLKLLFNLLFKPSK